MVAAAVKFTQGANVGAAGQALVGVAGQAVTVANGNNTGVSTYEYTLLSAPIGSALVPGVLGTSSTASFTPDVSGSYRVQVKVEGTAPSPVSDIRVFAVANARGWIVPAFGGRAGEHNFSGQDRGWAGTGSVPLMDAILTDLATVSAGGAPVNVTKETAAAGVSVTYARADHKHDISTAVPGSINLAGVTAAEGSSVSLARADHTHSLTGQLATASYADGSVTYAKVQNVTTDRLLGRDTAGSGPPEEISVDTTLAWSGTGAIGRAAISGDITIAAGSNTAAIAAGVIVNADVSASAAIALSKLATQAALTVVANATNATAVPTAVAASADGQVFMRSGTTLVFGTLATGGITDGAVTLAKLANGTALSVLGRSANTAGAYADMVAATDGDVMRRSGTSIGFGAPNFAAQNITTTGSLLLGANPSSSGVVRLPNAGDIVSRNGANTGNVSLLYLSGSDGIFVGGSSAASVALVTSAASLVLGTNAEFTCSQVRFDNTVTGPSFIQEDQTAASTNGQTLIIAAQNATGATSTGGTLDLRGGTGTTAAGGINFRFGSSISMAVTSNISMFVANARWGPSVPAPALFQDDQTATSTNGQTLLIQAQNATGTTSQGGDLRLRSGTGTSASGVLRLYAGGNNQMSIFDTGIDVNHPAFGFTSSVASPTFGQNTLSTASATGQTLIIRAQACSGATSTGGILDLRSGAGTSVDGNVNIRVGTTLKFQITPNVFSLSNPTLRFDSAQTSVLITQEAGVIAGGPTAPFTISAQDNSASSGRGASMTIRAGDASGATGTRTGGALILRSGNGFDVTSAATPGDVTIGRGSTVVANWQGSSSDYIALGASPATTGSFRLSQASKVVGRSSGGVDRTLFDWGTNTADELVLGDTGTSVSIKAAGALTVSTAGTPRINFSTAVTIYSTICRFDAATGNPTFAQETSTAAATGQTLTLNAQDCSLDTGATGGALLVRAGDATGTSGTRTGGTLTIRSGNGATANGKLALYGGNGVGFELYARNNTNSANVLLSFWDSSTGRLTLGDASTLSTSYIYLQSGLMQLRAGTNSVLDITSSVIRPVINAMSWDASVPTAPFINQVTATGATATGAPFTIAAQDCSGTATVTAGSMTLRAGNATGASGTRNGGALVIASGTGATADGDLTLKRGSVNVLVATSSSTSIGDTTFIGIEHAYLASARDVIALCNSTAITTTEMPANTGNGVVFVADAASSPTSGLPSGGGILAVDTNLGLQWKGKRGVETTLAPHGDSGNTKRRLIDWKSQPTLITWSDTTVQTAASFDATNFNGQSMVNGILRVKARYVVWMASGPAAYAVSDEFDVVVTVESGAVFVGSVVNPKPASSSNDNMTANTVVDVSGTTVRLRLSQSSASGTRTSFAFFEVTGFAV